MYAYAYGIRASAYPLSRLTVCDFIGVLCTNRSFFGDGGEKTQKDEMFIPLELWVIVIFFFILIFLLQVFLQ